MSYQATTAVTEHSKHSGSELLCLLMLANYASPDGTNIRPSITRLAKDCRMSERGVRYIMAKLVESGELVQTGTHINNVKVYRIALLPFGGNQALQTLQGLAEQALQKRTASPAIAVSASPAIAVAGNQLEQSKISQNDQSEDFVEISLSGVPTNVPCKTVRASYVAYGAVFLGDGRHWPDAPQWVRRELPVRE